MRPRPRSGGGVHGVTRSLGGSSDPSNLQAVHRLCNARKPASAGNWTNQWMPDSAQGGVATQAKAPSADHHPVFDHVPARSALRRGHELSETTRNLSVRPETDQV